MADFFKGLSGGFQSGLQLSQALRDREERARLREAVGLTPQEVQQREATPDEIGRARAEAQAMSAQDAEVFGLSPQEQAAYAPQMPVQGQRVGLPRYQLAGQMYDRAPTPQEIQQARYGAMADVIAERDPAAGLRMRRELEVAKRQDELYPLEKQKLEGALELQNVQTQGAKATLASTQRTLKKQTDFDTGFAKINETKYEKPEDRTNAILDLYERTEGPEARQRLQSSYTQTELNNISLQAKKFDEGFRQSRAKGVIPALEWFDEQNTSFKLERDPKNPFRYIQVNTDGTRSVFADAKNERELGMIIDAKAKPGGFLQLAQYDLDVKKANDLAKYYANVGATRGVTSLKQQVADFKEVFGRDPSEEEKGIMAKLINKESNKPEFSPEKYAATVKSFTDAGFSPTDALIRADQLYGRGPAEAKVDENLQDANKKKGSSTKQAPALKGPGDVSPVDIQQIRSRAAELDAAIVQAQTQASGAVRSQDVTAIKLYGDKLNDLRAQRAALTSGLTGPAQQMVGLR